MNQDVADAITVIEKRMAEKDQKIAALEQKSSNFEYYISNLKARIFVLESAANAFAKGLGK